ncbi:hypothetical protein IPG36_00030 [bacterium]|nr:MAG: hypothetical protein IPG36_00030 [bacterium]
MGDDSEYSHCNARSDEEMTTPSIRIATPDDLSRFDPDMPNEDWTRITGVAFTFLTRIKATGLINIQLARAALRDEVRLIQFLNWCEVLLSTASELDFANRYSSYLESVAGIYAPQILNDAYGAEYDEDRHIIQSFAQENGLEKIAHAFYAIWFVHAGRPRYISGPHE